MSYCSWSSLPFDSEAAAAHGTARVEVQTRHQGRRRETERDYDRDHAGPVIAIAETVQFATKPSLRRRCSR